MHDLNWVENDSGLDSIRDQPRNAQLISERCAIAKLKYVDKT